MKTSTPQALKAHAMAFNPQITVADAVKQGLLVPLQASSLSAVASTPTIPAPTTAPAPKPLFHPGPLAVTESAFSHGEHGEHGELHVGDSRETVAVVYFDRNEPASRREAEANAQLFASAPDLLANLQKVLTWAETYARAAGIDLIRSHGPLATDIDEARVLIQKIIS